MSRVLVTAHVYIYYYMRRFLTISTRAACGIAESKAVGTVD